MSKTFKEVATEHLKRRYSLEYTFKEDDPLSCRAEFLWAIDNKEPLAYLYDSEIPESMLTGIDGFEAALEDPGQIVQILIAPCILYKGEAFHNLPDLIPPFSNEIFPMKDPDFQVSLGDLIEESDDEDWADELNDNFSLWEMRRREFLTDQLWPVMLVLEGKYPGITLGFMKSVFVTSFYDIEPDKKTGEFDVDDLWEIFGWTLDLWGDWADDKKETRFNIKKVSSQDEEDRAEFEAEIRKLEGDKWDDYNEEY